MNTVTQAIAPPSSMAHLLPDPTLVDQWRGLVTKKIKRVASMVERQYLQQTGDWRSLDTQRDQLFHLIELNFYHLEDWRAVIDAVLSGDPHLQRRGPWERWGDLLTLALKAARHLAEPTAEAEIAFRLGTLRAQQGRLQAAETLFNRAEQLWTQQGDHEKLPQIWRQLAEQQIAQGDYAAAQSNLERAWQQLQSAGIEQGLAELYCSWGLLADKQGERLTAINWYGKALALPSTFLTKNTLCLAHQRLATLHCHVGRYEEALTHLAAAQPIAESTGDDSALCRILATDGMVWGICGQLQRSIAYFHQMGAVAERCGNLTALALSHSNLAVSYYRLGQFTQALTEVRHAGRLAKRLEHYDNHLTCQINECEILCILGQPAAAQAALSVAETLLADMEYAPELVAFMTGAKARVARLLGDVTTALQAFHQAITLMEETGNRFEAAEYAIELVPLYLARQEWTAAQQWIATVRAIGVELHQDELIGQAEALTGDLARWQGDSDAAQTAYAAARTIFLAQGNDRCRYLAGKLAA